MDKLRVYVHKDEQEQRLVERLRELAKRRERSVNYLAIQAILEFLQREERKHERRRK